MADMAPYQVSPAAARLLSEEYFLHFLKSQRSEAGEFDFRHGLLA
jgi:hypothetical protein